MSIQSFLASCKRLLKLATKPSRSELWTSIKLSVAGVAIIGLVGYIIRLISALLQGFG
jgi:protein translocase SEC61 complex gamma subunit